MYNCITFTSSGKKPNLKNITISIDVITTVKGVGILRNHFAFSGVIFLEFFFFNRCNPINIPENCGMKYKRLKASENNIFESNDSPNLEKVSIVAPGVRKKSVKIEIII